MVDRELNFNDFKECVISKNSIHVNQNLFKVNKHEISIVKQIKKALSVHINKWYILENGFDTLTWRHPKLRYIRDNCIN